MDVVDILAIVVLIAAAATGYLFYASKRKRPPQRLITVAPPGLKVKPLADAPPATPRAAPPRPVPPRPVAPRSDSSRGTPARPESTRPVQSRPDFSRPTPSRPAPAVSQAAEPDAGVPAAAASPPLFDLDLEPAAVTGPAEIRWCQQFDPRSGVLDETARLRLIGDLGVIAKDWCVPLLAQAYEEESKPAHRQAALIGLTSCRSRTAAATFRIAMASGDAAERAIAADGLADLEQVPQTKLRRTVERH